MMDINQLLRVLLLICLVETSGQQSAKGTEILAIAETVKGVIDDTLNLVMDILNEQANNKIMKGIKRLQESINHIQNKLQYIQSAIEKLPYDIIVTQHIEKVVNCLKELNIFLESPTKESSKDNLKHCYGIRENVRLLGMYLKGDRIGSSWPLFELDAFRSGDGGCDGSAIKNTYNYLFGLFFKGCIIVTAAEELKYKNESGGFHKECKNMTNGIRTYMAKLYGKCIQETCSVFLTRTYDIITTSNWNLSAISNNLNEAFPWFHFLLIKYMSGSSTIDKNPYTPINIWKFNDNNDAIILVWSDIFVEFTNQTTDNNDLVIRVLKGQSFVSYAESMIAREMAVGNTKLYFIAASSNIGIDNCNYDDSPPKLSNAVVSVSCSSVFLFASIVTYFVLA